MKKNHYFLTKLYLSTLAVACLTPSSSHSMGQEQHTNTTLEPSYTEPEESTETYNNIQGVIFDEGGKGIRVEKISFGGKTSLGGIRKETDDSSNSFNLATIKTITIVDGNFMSKRYSDKEFANVSLTTHSNAEESDLLVPRKIVISGIDRNTSMKKAWFFGKIKKIILEKPVATRLAASLEQSTTPPQVIQEKKDNNFLENAASVARRAGDSLVSAVKKAKDYLTPSEETPKK
jgi:hypothetical protein